MCLTGSLSALITVSYFHRAMASISWALLLFIAQLHTLLSTSNAHHDHGHGGNLTHLPVAFLCHPDQAKALLQLKKSFFFRDSTTRLSSWRNGTDCCLWEGVGCDTSSGHVTILDLNNLGLFSYGLDPAIFSLTSLRRLDLSMNNFGGYYYNNFIAATGFERFTFLTHLNLSNSGLYGQIPIGISKLVKLLSLDLSSCSYIDYFSVSTSSNCKENGLWETSFDTLVANLSNLRELYLDLVDLSNSGEEWCLSLAKYVPKLRVLSLSNCGLRGPIDKSLSRLHSLVVINLQQNNGITAGPFPEFFKDFLNLTVLRLSDVNLQGWFPSRPFQSKNLRVLDLSNNQNLSGHLPSFSDASSLEILRLDGTNFSYARPISSSNFKSLKVLSLDGSSVSVDLLSSLSTFGYLRELNLKLDLASDLRSIFSLIVHYKNLTDLTLYGCNFSGIISSSVSNLKTLRSLRMVFCNLPRPVLHAIGNLMGLQTLAIHVCTIHGSIPSSIGNLTNLRNMYIGDSVFSGPLPATIGNLTNLRNMYISDSVFSGPMPATIGKLRNLRNMYILYTVFSGPMPATIGKLTNLRNMDIEQCHFTGSMPATIGNLTNLKTMVYLQVQNSVLPIPYAIGQLRKLELLNLEGSNFSGSIPSSIANLTRLTGLFLAHNCLHGEIPLSIFSLHFLRTLDLSFNQLSGPIHNFDKAVSRLQTVDLSNNVLSGFIPEAIFELTSLSCIDFSSNNLIGSVDLSHFWRLNDLVILDLSNNKLHVKDTDGDNPLATYLAGLGRLGLASCNITRFPRFLRRLNHISDLDLSSNKISGDIPNWIWEKRSSSLISLNLSHNMFTGMQLPSDVIPLTTPLSVLDFSFNRLSGRMPMPNSSAFTLDYSNNRFSSVLPNWAFYLGRTSYLSMAKNNISGHVPLSICNSKLDVLDLSYNKFSGSIPSCLTGNVPLMVLNLRENQFEGTLSSNITTRCALQTIDLHGNRIEGQLPRGLSNCSSLEVLDLGGNQLADTFPSWLSGLPELSVLVLRSNQLYGSIDDTIEDTESDECFPSLQIIDLASNNFSGNLRTQWFTRLKSMMGKVNHTGETIYAHNISGPTDFYQDSIVITYKGSYMTFERILTTLTAIDFSNNRLEGNIPESFGKLVSLRVLNMSHNAFTGKIPAELGGMTALESLDLSCNQLSDGIPQELADLTFLEVLNLSNNHLVGKIPQSRQFSTFDSSSFGGNEGLCGPPLSKLPCGASPYTPGVAQVNKPFHHVDVVLFLFVGLGFGVGFAAAVLVKWGWIGRWFIATVRGSTT